MLINKDILRFRVKNGVAWLEEVCPDIVDEIPIDKLDLTSSYYDLIHYIGGERIIDDLYEFEKITGINYDLRRQLGFFAFRCEVNSEKEDRQFLQILTQLWQEELYARREKLLEGKAFTR